MKGSIPSAGDGDEPAAEVEEFFRRLDALIG